MRMRVGKVTKVYPNTGKMQVLYEDEGNASLQLSMITMNQEYSLPKAGDRVVTMHMENGSSKGFVLGTYYGGSMQPKANTGYRKDYEGGAYTTCRGGAYRTSASSIALSGSSKASISGGGAGVSLNGNASMVGAEVMVGSAAASEDEESEEIIPDVYVKITEDKAEIKSVTDVSVLAEGGKVEIESEAGSAKLTLDSEAELKAQTLNIEGDDLTLKCSYGSETFEKILKRIERIEDMLGLPHDI